MIKQILVFILLIVFFVGCATVGRKIDFSKVDKIKIDKTTQRQVLSYLGSPDTITRQRSQTIYMYQYVNVSSRPENFIPIFGAFAGGMDTQSQMVMITFNQDGIVKDVYSSMSSSDVDSGLNAGSKADVKEVEQNKRPK